MSAWRELRALDAAIASIFAPEPRQRYDLRMRLCSGWSVTALLALLLVSGGCGRRGSEAEARVYAAGSLTEVVGAVARRFEPLSGVRVVPSYGASNTLALQIREG